MNLISLWSFSNADRVRTLLLSRFAARRMLRLSRTGCSPTQRGRSRRECTTPTSATAGSRASIIGGGTAKVNRAPHACVISTSMLTVLLRLVTVNVVVATIAVSKPFDLGLVCHLKLTDHLSSSSVSASTRETVRDILLVFISTSDSDPFIDLCLRACSPLCASSLDVQESRWLLSRDGPSRSGWRGRVLRALLPCARRLAHERDDHGRAGGTVKAARYDDIDQFTGSATRS